MWKNLTGLGRFIVVLLIAAALLGAAYVFKDRVPANSQPQASTETSLQMPAAPRSDPEPPKSAEVPKKASEPVAIAPKDEPANPKPAPKSNDPWADLKIEKKGQ